MALAIFGWLRFGEMLNVWILVPVGVAIGGAVYFGILFALRVPELGYVVNGVMRRLKR
jgi:hypothetical protein